MCDTDTTLFLDIGSKSATKACDHALCCKPVVVHECEMVAGCGTTCCAVCGPQHEWRLLVVVPVALCHRWTANGPDQKRNALDGNDDDVDDVILPATVLVVIRAHMLAVV